jgi:hypothetical protein
VTKRAGNLKRHLKRIHKKQNELYELRTFYKSRYKKTKGQLIKFEINKNDITTEMIDIFVNGGCSFNLINLQGFRQIAVPIMLNLGLTLNIPIVKNEIKQQACSFQTFQTWPAAYLDRQVVFIKSR